MFFPKLKLTDGGRALLSEVISGGGTLNFAAFALGDGYLPAGEDGTHLTALINQIGLVSISSIETGDGGASMSASVDTTQLPGAVTGRELGIYADDLDGGAPILYAYTNAGDMATYIPQGSGDTYQRITLNVVVAVGDAEDVTATIGGITGYATTEQLDAHKNDNTNPHHVTKEQVGLGNVENKEINNQTPTYTAPETLQNLSSGETLRVAFGKLAQAVWQLIEHIGNRSNPHGVTAAQIGAANSNHSHNASSISETTDRKWMTAAERTKLASLAGVVPITASSQQTGLYYLTAEEKARLAAVISAGQIPILVHNTNAVCYYYKKMYTSGNLAYVLFFETVVSINGYSETKSWIVDMSSSSAATITVI